MKTELPKRKIGRGPLRLKLKLCFLLMLSCGTALHAQRNLSNANASKEAKALYRYIQDMYGKKIFSGQMWSGYSGDELAYVQTNTGKQPALRGMDFMTASDNNAEVQRAIDWWNSGGIPTIMWHWGAPTKGDGYTASQQTIDINRCFQPGTAEYTAFWNELRLKADLLQRLRDANIPILWRPYHELNGGWFWWGKGGATQFKRLWTTMYNYFVNDRGLNNLIWVLCYTGDPDGNWFPGNQYVDIAGADTYAAGEGPQLNMYNQTKNSLGGNVMPIAYHECGTPPNPDQCKSQGAMWSWWMEWHSSHLYAVDKTYLRFVYNHDLVITKDEIPNILQTYGGTACGTAPNGYPYCCTNSDPDGDGWGWENNASCVVQPTTLPNGTYTITARHSGKVLDVYNNSMDNDGNVNQWTYNANAANQKWVVDNVGSGTYSIKALHSGKALDVAGNSLADGADINQWTYNATANQKWRIESVGSGFYRIVSVNSGKCIDVVANATADGAAINQYVCTGTNNQSFSFQPAAATARLATAPSDDQVIEEKKPAIYPNPSNGLFNVACAGSFSYIITNFEGAEIEKGYATDEAEVGKKISIPGIYILQIGSPAGSKRVRLIKK